MKPTNELRWVKRREEYHIPNYNEIVYLVDRVLQQKWVEINEMVSGSITGTLIMGSEWRDVPTVEAEGEKENK